MAQANPSPDSDAPDAQYAPRKHPLMRAIADASGGIASLGDARARLNHQLAKVRSFGRSRNPNMNLFDRELGELSLRIAEVIRHEKRLLLPDEKEQHELRTLRTHAHELESRLVHAQGLVRDLLHHNKRIAQFETKLTQLGASSVNVAQHTVRESALAGIDAARRAASTISKSLRHDQLRTMLASCEAQYVRLKHTASDAKEHGALSLLEKRMADVRNELAKSSPAARMLGAKKTSKTNSKTKKTKHNTIKKGVKKRR